MWLAGEPQVRPSIPPQGYGASLSTTDMQSIAKFLEEFAVRVLLPYLEVRVRTLNHQVGCCQPALSAFCELHFK